MKAVGYILFGALFTSATSLALGLGLFRALAIRLRQGEERLLAFVTGSAMLSGIVFLLCTVQMARKGIFLAIGGVAIAGAYRLGAWRAVGEALPGLSARWKWIWGVVFGGLGVFYFFKALVPEASPDGTAYHLLFPGEYFRAHGFVRIPTNLYANLSQGVELLFLVAYTFGKHSAATLVHFSFLVVTPWMMIAWGRRFGHAGAATAGAIFFFAAPVVAIDGTSAYVDVALAGVLFALFYLLQIWDAERDAGLLIPIGILAGFSFAVKYTAFIAVPYALGFVVWKLWGDRRSAVRAVGVIGGVASVFVLPWLIKNYLWIGNPFSPFLNAVFPNPWFHISFEREYSSYLRTYGIKELWRVPWYLTVEGFHLTGLFGPLYLLTPLGLLALRGRVGRQVLLAGFVFTLPYFTNIGTRFLIPAAPLLSIGIGMAFARWDLLLAALALGHSVASWPDFIPKYSSEYSWHVDGRFRLAPALRQMPEDKYLGLTFTGYAYDRMIERRVPPGERVFSLGGVAEAYTNRRILVKYLSAPNEVLGDIIWSPLYPEMQPGITVDYRFGPRRARKLRVVKSKDMGDAMWSIAELRIYNQGKELARDPKWRLRAKPNPWDVQLAFDNSPVTRWRTWEDGKAGMYVEVDFGGMQAFDSVRVETNTDWRDPDMRVEAMDEAGRWAVAGTAWDRRLQPMKVNLRKAATAELKARGIRYLLVGIDDIGSEDFHQYSDYWGIRFLEEAGYTRLYYIE